MTILDLISNNTGYIYKRKSSTEFAGPCPWCNGDDRFSIIPSNDHFVCRMCKCAGDSIEFVKKYHKKTYFEACTYLNIQPHINFKSLDVSNNKDSENQIIWKPRETINPPEEWQKKATAILFESYKYLMSSAGKPQRDYLNSRGINNQTIKIARLGYNKNSITFSKESWGMKPDKDSSSKIWIPQGIIIPNFKNNKVTRLRIRQDKPLSKNRYIIVSGSNTEYLNCDKFLHNTGQISQITNQKHKNSQKNHKKPVFITEAELDGWLAYQELNYKFSIFAIGNSSARPDVETDKILKIKTGLLNLDNDDAGKEETVWWGEHYLNLKPFFTDHGKDLGESFEAGVDIKKWGETGLNMLNLNIENIKNTGDDQFENKSFIDDVVNDYNKQNQTPFDTIKEEKKSIIEPEIKTVDPSADVKICLHGIYCQNLKNRICLLDNLDIWSTDKACPKDQWYRHKACSGAYELIILGIGVKK